MPVSHCPYGFYGQVTVETVGWSGAWPCWPYWPYGFFALEQKFRTVRLTVETVATDRRDRRSWLYLAARTVTTVICYGLLRSADTVSTISTFSCYGLYGLYGQLLRLIKGGLDRGGFILSSSAVSQQRCQQRSNSSGSPARGPSTRTRRVRIYQGPEGPETGWGPAYSGDPGRGPPTAWGTRGIRGWIWNDNKVQ